MSPELQLLLQIVLASAFGYLVTEALKVIADNTGIDLSGYSARITAALVTGSILFANQLLSLVPAQFQPVIGPACAFLVAVFGAFGFYATLNKKAKPA